jgi:hypothetical protein
MSLIYRSIDIMKQTKDSLDNPISSAFSNNEIDSICRDYPTVNLISIAIPMNTNAQALAVRGSNFGIEPATYAAQFMNRIHTNNRCVLFRGTDCAFEGIYNFPKVNYRNGSKYTYYGEDITDNFSSGFTRNHGYSLTSAAGNLSSQYLTSHQSGNTWTISGNHLVGPANNGWRRTCLWNFSYFQSVTMTAQVRAGGNSQIIVRATTDTNFPGYGLQMRGSNTLRIERPGIANLGEVTNKTFVSGTYYWLKLQAIGTAIKGKSWAVGDSEPGTWDIEITNSDYSTGYCGFSGESDGPVFGNMTITPSIDTDTWIYRAATWVNSNISLFATNDLVVPFAEADMHNLMGNVGNYNQFFLDLSYVLERIGRENGRNILARHFSHLWSYAMQGQRNAQYSQFGVATYDHYGTSIGLNKRFVSFNSQATISATNTYVVPTSITEGATAKFNFTPEKPSYNTDIDLYVVDKGTGNWTMTIHDSNNNKVQMPDQHNFSNKTTTGVVTIANASLTSAAVNTFSIDWDNPVPDVGYHLHLTSTVGDGTVKVATANDLNTLYATGYKSNASPKAMEIDIRKTYVQTGNVPQFIEEWGDFWSTDPGLSNPVRTQAEHTAYLDEMYGVFQYLVNDGILVGFNYWDAVGGRESVMYDADQTAGYDFQMLYSGVSLQTFFAANSGTTTSTSTTTTTTSTSSSTSSSSSTTTTLAFTTSTSMTTTSTSTTSTTTSTTTTTTSTSSSTTTSTTTTLVPQDTTTSTSTSSTTTTSTTTTMINPELTFKVDT